MCIDCGEAHYGLLARFHVVLSFFLDLLSFKIVGRKTGNEAKLTLQEKYMSWIFMLAGGWKGYRTDGHLPL